ncbi:arginase [Actinosynnema sp. ALI-1.44]|uniref:arginase family protein n=1 Tax=Actinosynnema sp. ALI-1.44 TaxID=1933779 RepID=UPI00097BD6B4|nr:arginase family protein [Actinosynnema sp. ALI-1.44]ONI75151.1 arginase [Actinosynnema sp. ALI-1.44]
MTTVLCVPQWQGSASTDAPRLVAGAKRAAALIAAESLVTVPVPDTSGDKQDGVRALATIRQNLELTREALAGVDGMVITVGGDCGVDLVPIARAGARYGEALTVLWFDAHPDCFTGDTLPSGAFHGMVVRTLLGDGPAALTQKHLLTSRQIVLAGLRAGEPSEYEYIERTGIRKVGVDDLDSVLDGLRGPVYVHIDLDVLEPARFGSVCYPEPDGVLPERLIDVVSRLDNVVGAGITEHAPADGEPRAAEAEVIRQLGAVLTRSK